ncbi:response regulator [Paenibacillus hexagrammi]|uniref:Response regulator n=1 Tax=Paenibacillus hexagrammi TaxID=2908839 RepID=A0ABY3SL56_9BACL|nr:response regulator [Paenibacillus sp. YPD9-1]UJF34793.1 response regulator [Paenibacillus sp. YPD9-1]
MLKTVIVDDEPKLRQGLQTLIPWGSLGFQVIAAAANGQEALNVLKSDMPDLVIVDIRMPVMDGLQFIQHASTLGVHLHMIILSGYADFEYAQQAIKFGVDGYLLKPVDIGEMTALLKQVRERIEEERHQGELRQLGIINRDFLLHRLLIPQGTTEDPIKMRSKTKEADLLWDNYEAVVIYPQVFEEDRTDELVRICAGLKPRIESLMLGLVTILAPYTVLLLSRAAARE